MMRLLMVGFEYTETFRRPDIEDGAEFGGEGGAFGDAGGGEE